MLLRGRKTAPVWTQKTQLDYLLVQEPKVDLELKTSLVPEVMPACPVTLDLWASLGFLVPREAKEREERWAFQVLKV
ncbi:uncharacterized protein LOC133645328 isoform X2 [Entelurus aequoreus]|uniref:uncharacterized protein LOC133645328 isoform X2 n=1 Tax=Entelurus aequoreus TaxID=161455 RepID=UPI002B1E0934|nr:uncharacterized protein LOC133645328 isoform X2 [Entelurus aequoreus]XP_061896203.1 uncharacterized protein LOC133645328 isoform X2 [Entelurus aequoreus]XP_061896204.1 uncharacterized protein LOC133645328 isoform X2 [Entelurus aequoreus]